MTISPVVLLIAAIGERAKQLGLTPDENAEVTLVTLRDYARRRGHRRDRRQPQPPCTLVPCPGLRLHVYGDRRTFSYHLRRAPTKNAAP